jgi:hypothetical protein
MRSNLSSARTLPVPPRVESMTKQKAIRKFCLSCCEYSKDVALCTDPSCPLWPFRLGFGLNSVSARKYMDTVKDRYPDDVAALAVYGISEDVYFPPQAHARAPRISGLNDLGGKRRKRVSVPTPENEG